MRELGLVRASIVGSLGPMAQHNALWWMAPVRGWAALGMTSVTLLACQHGEPPGAERERHPVVLHFAAVMDHTEQSGAPASHPGSIDDRLPFEPKGEQLASIAWRTWIYTDTGPRRTRYGYLRAGAVVDRRGPPIVNDGCAGGWYRINPRGFVCIGKGATLDLQHPAVLASGKRAQRRAGLPYAYALAKERPPHRYFKLPTARQMREVEGGYEGRAINWVARYDREQPSWLELAPEPPAWLQRLGALTKPYGVEQPLRYSVHAGRTSATSGWALSELFRWQQRGFGLTTELDLVPLDRMNLVKPSSFRGVQLHEGEELPVLLVRPISVPVYELGEQGRMRAVGALARRTLVALTGKNQRIGGVRFWQTRDDRYVAEAGNHLIEPRKRLPSVATGERKWIDISIRDQTLVAYEGRRPVYVTLVSAGRGGLGDPSEVPATVQGTFMIHAKHVTATMDGDDDVSESYELHDVPFVQYFHKGYALHVAYWHDDFGRPRSSGCVNLSPYDGSWLFEWSDPSVPDHWHAVINKERGTVVIVRP